MCCLPGSSPSRHFQRREDPGDEVGGLGARGGPVLLKRIPERIKVDQSPLRQVQGE